MYTTFVTVGLNNILKPIMHTSESELSAVGLYCKLHLRVRIVFCLLILYRVCIVDCRPGIYMYIRIVRVVDMKRHMKDSILPVVLKSEMSSVGSTKKRIHRHIYLGIRRVNLRNGHVNFDTRDALMR